MSETKPYIGSCVELDAMDLHLMMASLSPVSYFTFRHRFLREQWTTIREQFGYAYSSRYGLTMEDDWHVRYYRGLFKGKEVIVLQHSAIEYIWDDDVSVAPNSKLKRQVAL